VLGVCSHLLVGCSSSTCYCSSSGCCLSSFRSPSTLTTAPSPPRSASWTSSTAWYQHSHTLHTTPVTPLTHPSHPHTPLTHPSHCHCLVQRHGPHQRRGTNTHTPSTPHPSHPSHTLHTTPVTPSHTLRSPASTAWYQHSHT